MLDFNVFLPSKGIIIVFFAIIAMSVFGTSIGILKLAFWPIETVYLQDTVKCTDYSEPKSNENKFPQEKFNNFGGDAP